VSGHLRMRLLALLLRAVCAPFVRFEVRGGACVRERDGLILSGNHRTVFDFVHAVVGLHHFGKDARILIASELFEHPVYRLGCRFIRAIPVYRSTDPRGAFDAAVAALRAGDNVCIMPEGRLTWDPAEPLSLGPFKTGVSRMATGAGAPVVPLALVGGERLWPKGAKLPRLRLRRTVVLLQLADEPMLLEGGDHRANADAVRSAQLELLARGTRELQRVDPGYLPALPA
jgi:1-acyl-sn-glycerol-3-phosphate acyltransferase